jgi:predicted amidohydrolase
MIKIALAQFCIDYDNIQKNITKGFSFISKSIDNGCQVIILPELWSTGFKFKNLLAFSEVNVSLIDRLNTIATKDNVEIMGSYIVKQDEFFHNEFIALRPEHSSESYKKIHLFPSLQEPQFLRPGTEVKVFDSILGNTGPSICFDLRFPEVYTEIARKMGQTHVIPAHWPAVRIHHWDILLQARAIETMSYVIGVNSVGKSGKTFFGGHSAVISPNGEVMAQASSTDEELCFLDINPELPERVRKAHSFFPEVINTRPK